MTTTATTTATPTTEDVEIHLPEQVRLVTEILHMMVGIDVHYSHTAWIPDQDVIFASVGFKGAWTGAMTFSCTMPMAFHLAEEFMSVPLPDSADDDVRDSLGELANMMAGNFKALLPTGSILCIPRVAMYVPQAIHVIDSCVLCQSVFQSEFGECCLTLEHSRPTA